MPDLTWPKLRKLLRAPDIGFNAEVFRHFKENLDPADVGGRTKVRDFCLIGAKDSRTTAEAKIRFFRDQVQKVHNKTTIIGELKTSRDEKVTYRPQVILYFEQDKDSVPSGKTPLNAEISFRLHDETYETITKTKYEQLAQKIKTEFATPQRYAWSKGKHICWYKDESKGYDFQVYALSEAEGEKVIKKVMDIRSHNFEENIFKITTPKKSSDNTPSNVKILGKTRKKPRWRPTATVRFMWADLVIWNVPEPITLVDTTGIRYNPVILSV